jgi:hypothetical protein
MSSRSLPPDDPRHIEDVVDQARLGPCVALDDLEDSASVFRCIPSTRGHRPAENRTERRSQLVRNDGQEVVLGPVRPLRLLASELEFLAVANLLGHVHGEDDDRLGAVAAVAQGLQREIRDSVPVGGVRRGDLHRALANRERLPRGGYTIEQGHQLGRRAQLTYRRAEDLAILEGAPIHHVRKLAYVAGHAHDRDERRIDVEGGLESLAPLILALPKQVDERLDAGPHDCDIERLGDVVRGARVVALGDGVKGSEKQDGDLASALCRTDPRRRLEPVHRGHLDVDQDDRKPVLKDEIERLRPGARFDDLRADGLEHRRERQQVRRRVVNQQDAWRSRLEGGHDARKPGTFHPTAQPRSPLRRLRSDRGISLRAPCAGDTEPPGRSSRDN